MELIPSKDGKKLIPAWYGTRSKTGPSEPMDPLKGIEEIQKVREMVKDNARDLALFTIGINTAYRGGDILRWTVGMVRGLKVGDDVTLKEQKTSKRRRVTLNQSCISAIEALLATRPNTTDDDYLFVGDRGEAPLNVKWLGLRVKKWCKQAGLDGTYGSHSLRKTWGYMQRTLHNRPIELLQQAYGHSSPSVTLAYICIQAEELHDMYMCEF